MEDQYLDFDLEEASLVNPHYSGSLDASSNAAADLFGGTVASVVDFGASVFNSLAPESYEVSTADLLGRISDNALRVYNENPDAVHTASFIGGVFVPSGLALKGMNALKSGSKALSMFGTERRAADIARLQTLALEGSKRTEEMRKMRAAIYGRGLAGQVLDAAAMEVAIITAMNDHPFMEDYLEDPIKNFGISMALGGAIGGGIGHIADRFAVNQGMGKVFGGEFSTLTSKLLPTPEGMPMADMIQLRQENINIMRSMLKDEANPPSEMLKEMISSVLTHETAAQITTFDKFTSSFLSKVDDPESHAIWLDRLTSDHRFQNIDRAVLAKVKERALQKPNDVPGLQAEFGEAFTTKVDDAGEMTKQKRTAVFFPEEDAFGGVKDMVTHGRANTIKGTTVESITQHKEVTASAILAPNTEASLLIRNMATPSVDKMYAEAFTYADQLDAKMLRRAAVDPDDLPMMSALIQRIQKDKDAFKDLKILLTKNEPKYTDEILQKIYTKEGVGKDYSVKLDGFSSLKATRATDPRANRISSLAHEMLQGWTSGNNVALMRSVADAAMYGGYGAASIGKLKSASGRSLAEYMQPFMDEIYNSPGSRAFRDQMRSIADPSGHVYLWRGHKGEVQGHAGLVSYTARMSKAEDFKGSQNGPKQGHVRLYKVHVDDIVAQIEDTGGGSWNEIIVRASKRETEPTLPVGKDMKEVVASAVAMKPSTTNKVGVEELIATAISTKERIITDMLAQGRTLREMSIRTNTPKETIEKWILSDRSGSLIEHGNVFEYHSMQSLKDKLGAANQPVAMSTNVRKEAWGAIAAKLDVSTANRINNQIMADFLLGSNTPTGRSLYNLIFAPEQRKYLDIIRSQVSMANNYFAGNRALQSADSFTAHMKELGVWATQFGKSLSDLSNHTVRRMTDPLKGTIEKIAGNVVDRTELSSALHLNASLRDWREYKDGKIWIKQEVRDPVTNKMVMQIVPARYGEKIFTIQSKDVQNLMAGLQTIGKEMYGIRNLSNKITGKPDMPNIGFWVPALNPREKHIAYLHNKADGTTQLIVGNTADELQTAIAAIKPVYAKLIDDGTAAIFTKADQGAVNIIAGRDDPIFMTVANPDKLHSGSSATAIVKNNADPLAELITGLEHSIKSSITSIAEMALYDVSDNLQRLSRINMAYHANQPLSRIKAAITKPQDAAKDVRDIMFDLKALPNYSTWQDINSGFEGALGYVLDQLTKGWKTVYEPAKQIFGKQIGEGKLNYEEYAKLLKKHGAMNPYTAYGEQAEEIWKLGSISSTGNQAKRFITLSNSYAATLALRFGDIAQPLVNAMSLPILMTAAIADKMPSSFMGAKLAGKILPAQAMHDGIRAMNSANFKHLDARWKAAGYYDAIVSEASEVLKLPRELTPGAMTAAEKAIESRLVNWFARPADATEALTRKVAMHTGAVMAKRLYPELGDAGVTLFARNFMDRVIGNYHAAQRPVFYQGTLGTAMGLFQTYMLTFAQSMYKQLQLQNYKALGKTMLAQATVFGAGSMPGFNQVSEMIGEHYSDDHVDLKTGTIRAVDDDMAKVILYGLPSSLGAAVYSRGDLAPRVSTPANLTMLPQVQMVGQTIETIGRVASALRTEAEDIPRSIGQAVAMQSVMRPLARMSEVAMGYSVTTQGTTVSTPEEVWTVTGVAARMLGTRPTDEALAREVHHLNRMYESTDRDNKQKVINRLRTAIRGGGIEDDQLEELAMKYMDEGGTPTGWRSAVRTAIMTTDMPLTGQLQEKLKDDSALNHMIDMLDEQ